MRKHTPQAFLSVLEETEDFFFPVNNSHKAYITASDFKRTEADSLWQGYMNWVNAQAIAQSMPVAVSSLFSRQAH